MPCSSQQPIASSVGTRSNWSWRLSNAEPLLGSTAPDTVATTPLLYGAILCEGQLRVEASIPALAASAISRLRTLSLQAEISLEASIAFASKDQIVPRKSSIGLPSAVTIHVLRKHGHSFVVVTLKAFEEVFASRFLEELCTTFADAVERRAQSRDRHNVQSGTAGSVGGRPCWRRLFARREERSPAEDSSLPDFSSQLEALLVTHGMPERLERLRRIRSVENASQEVVSVMEEALGRVLATSPNLEALEDKSEWLVAQASTFRREARGIRRQLCCRNLRLACCLCIFFIMATALAVLSILEYIGVIQLWPWSPHHYNSSAPFAPPQ